MYAFYFRNNSCVLKIRFVDRNTYLCIYPVRLPPKKLNLHKQDAFYGFFEHESCTYICLGTLCRYVSRIQLHYLEQKIGFHGKIRSLRYQRTVFEGFQRTVDWYFLSSIKSTFGENIQRLSVKYSIILYQNLLINFYDRGPNNSNLICTRTDPNSL
jgi:hypothetical protein